MAALCSQFQPAKAQQTISPALADLNTVVNAQGMPPSDPNAPLFRAGTSPLTPLTRGNGTPITLDDFNNATGQVRIAARPGGGTDVNVEVQGLFPGELYSVWAGYFQNPGFLKGTRVGFGAVSALGDGSDNFMVADANGRISLNLVQRQGPMTVHGNAPAYAPNSPLLDSNGIPQPHTGYNIAIAYHFNTPSTPPFLDPGPANKWALQAHAAFAPIPEPSALALGLLAISAVAVLRRSKPSLVN
jgi:hypothetical protein